MKTIGVVILFSSLLIACSSPKSENKEEQSETAEQPETKANVKDTLGFQTELTYPGSKISFKVKVEGNNLLIQPSGLSGSNEAFRHDITGYTVTNAEIGDLNVDGYPEVFVYLNSQGSGSYGKLIGYSVNDGKSASLVYLPEVAENKSINQGYMGHDQMAIVENTFCLRFPIYQKKDTNANPTGGTRQIQYKLVEGESGRILQIDKVMEF